MSETVREPAVAGFFYPADPRELEDQVRGFLAEASGPGPAPKALIVPHAGFLYSGPVAASGYSLVSRGIERVVLLGPAHRYPLRGLASHGADWFATPLGRVRLDRRAIDRALELPQVEEVDAAHAGEHSLEVHLPFLQLSLGEFALAPFVVGAATPSEVAEVLDLLWGGPETLIVISTDLSHFRDYASASRLDRATAGAIEELRIDGIGPEEACGCRAVTGLLTVARRKGMQAHTLDLRNSGDTAGGRDRVVGYGAFAVS